jgi:hypothetical protein
LNVISINLNQRELDIVRLSLLGLIEANKIKPFIHKHFNIKLEEVEDLHRLFLRYGLDAQRVDDQDYI